MRYQRIANKIVIQQSRIGSIILGIFLLIIIIGWQWLVFGMPKDLQELSSLDKGFVGTIGLNPVFFMVAGLPLFLLPSLIKNLRAVMTGRTIIIDGTAKIIFKNNKELLHFSEIQNFNFRNMEGISVELDCLLHNGKKIKLGNIGGSKNMDTYKTDILDVVRFSEKTLDERPRGDGLRKIFTVMHYFVLAVSILLLIGSLYALLSGILFTFFGTTTTGRIIDTKIETTERWVESGRVGRPKKKVRTTSTVYISTIEYQGAEGTLHTFESSAVDGGGNVQVVYFKFWPEYARVKSFSGNWGPFVILLVFSGIIFFISQLFNEKFFEKIQRKKNQRKLNKGKEECHESRSV